MTRIALALAVVSALSAVSVEALAQQRRGVVLEFSGRGGGVARNAVVSAASEHLELVPQEEFTARAESLGADLGDPAGVARVAQEMDVDLVIVGQVRGRRRRARTAIVIMDRDGNEVASENAASPPGRRGRQRLERAANRALEQALAAVPEREPEPIEAPPQDDLFGPGDDEIPGDGGFEEGEEPDEPGERLAVPVLEAMIGLGVRTRSATISLDTGGERGYSAGLFPEISLRLMLRPFASDDGALRGLFVHAEAFHSIGLSSQDRETMEEIGSSALRLLVQLGYLVAAGQMEIGAGLGVGYDAFLLDENATMSSSKYTYLRPGAVLRVPLSDEIVQLQIDAGLRVGLSTGGLTPMFAATASHFGYDVGAALYGNLESGVAYAVRLGYVGYSLSFEGDALMPMTNQGVEGSDGYFYVTLNGGYQFR
jgi:hypothetical protein